MIRKVVAIEGKQSNDRRLLLPDSLTVLETSVPVTVYFDKYSLPTVVGKATDFYRDVETGEIWFNITTKDKDLDALNAHLLCTGMESSLDDNDIMIIKSARIRSVFLSEAPGAWDNKGNSNE